MVWMSMAAAKVTPVEHDPRMSFATQLSMVGEEDEDGIRNTSDLESLSPTEKMKR
jgi:hypothetical protein